MGGAANLALPMGDVIDSVETFIHVFLAIYGVVLIAYIILSWIRLPYSLWLNRIQRFLYDVAEPYLRLFRRLLPMAGPIDFSPIIAFIALGVIDRLLIWILDHFR
jgi:YggT family protein